MNSIKRFTTCLDMLASLVPGLRTWAPTEEIATKYPRLCSSASTAALNEGTTLIVKGISAINETRGAPEEIEHPADIHLERIPPRIRVLLM